MQYHDTQIPTVYFSLSYVTFRARLYHFRKFNVIGLAKTESYFSSLSSDVTRDDAIYIYIYIYKHMCMSMTQQRPFMLELMVTIYGDSLNNQVNGR